MKIVLPNLVIFALAALVPLVKCLKILQIVPGYTNSHILFNYRLAKMLQSLNHNVSLFTQMEMAMILEGISKPPQNITEFRLDIHFGETMKVEGLQVFQSMMFGSGSAFDLWWTGQEFKGMRIESCDQMLSIDQHTVNRLKETHFDLAIAHFHDLCPLALAKMLDIKHVVWVTHGTSIFDYAAVQLGLRTFPSFVPHPLSESGDGMTFGERLLNCIWHFSTLDFVNLPQNLLHEENELYQNKYTLPGEPSLWQLSKEVRMLFLNGEQYLDFPRPLPSSISFMGQLTSENGDGSKPSTSDADFAKLMDNSRKGVIIFSLGTVSNTSNMPVEMRNGFLDAFSRFPDYTILWRLEADFSDAQQWPHIHLVKWIPQKKLMSHPKMRLLIAHGGYNSLLETAKAGIPVLLMPLFADQMINAKRAVRFGIGRTIDKLKVSGDIVAKEMDAILNDASYTYNARKLAGMLNDKPVDPAVVLDYHLRLATKKSLFTLNKAQKLNFIQHYCLDVIAFFTCLLVATIWCSLKTIETLYRAIATDRGSPQIVANHNISVMNGSAKLSTERLAYSAT